MKDYFKIFSKVAQYERVNMISEKIAKTIRAGTAEQEVERLLKEILKTTKWKNKIFSVGGYVRDELLGLDSKDIDIVVEEEEGSQKVTALIHETFPTQTTKPYQLGKNYPIWQLTFIKDVEHGGEMFMTKGAVVEFADTMKETFPDELSRQRKTEFGTIEEDIARRDFTVNMMLKDLTTGEFVDLTGTSKQDIQSGILRGHPQVSMEKIFNDDPLRMLRLIRFQCKYGWRIPISVLKTVKKVAKRIEIVSAERITGELTKVMKMGKLKQAIKLMKATGLLQYVLPEIKAMIGVKQPEKYHGEGDAFNHMLLVLENAPATIEGQLAALLHDVGKPQTQQIMDGAIKFLGHEEVGAKIAEQILRRMKFDIETIKKVVLMVRNHMRVHSLGEASNKALRKFIREIGDEMLDAILDLAEADAKGSLPVRNDIPEVRERVKQIKESPIPVKKKPVLNGDQIMHLLNIKAGELVGQIGKYLIELEDEYAENGTPLSEDEAIKKVLENFKTNI